jgi:hypothetical protein
MSTAATSEPARPVQSREAASARFEEIQREIEEIRAEREKASAAIAAAVARGEAVTRGAAVLHAREMRLKVERGERTIAAAVAEAEAALERWDQRAFHADARFGDAILHERRASLAALKASTLERLAEAQPEIAARRRERQEAYQRTLRERLGELERGRERAALDDAESRLETERLERRLAEAKKGGARSPSPGRRSASPSRRRPASPPRERAQRAAPPASPSARESGANLTKSSVSASFLDDTGDGSADVEAERAAWNAELERRRAELESERLAEAAKERSDAFKNHPATTSTAAPLSTPAELPIPERFVSSGAFMAVTTRTTERLTADDARAALAELRATQTSADAAELRRLMERFSDVEENDAAAAASEMADMLTPRGNSEAARNALVARLAQMFRAVIEHRLDLDSKPPEGYVPSWARREPTNRGPNILGGVLGELRDKPAAAAASTEPPKIISRGVVSTGGRGRGGSLNLGASAAFAKPPTADLDESDELEAALRALPSPTAARAKASEEKARKAKESEEAASDDDEQMVNVSADVARDPSPRARQPRQSEEARDATEEKPPYSGELEENKQPSLGATSPPKNRKIGGAVGSILSKALNDESDTSTENASGSFAAGGGGVDGGSASDSTFDF